MSKRFIILAVAVLIAAGSSGCGFRRGCSSCNSKSELPPLPPPPPPSNYCPTCPN